MELGPHLSRCGVLTTDRRAGILLHPTSLHLGDGVGDLGAGAEAWLEWLETAGQSLWQILPLGPTSLGNSPYSGLSAFAGSPLLISIDRMVADGFPCDLSSRAKPRFPRGRVHYRSALRWKSSVLRRTWSRFRSMPDRGTHDAFHAFREAPEQRTWLPDWSLYCALRGRFRGRAWVDWDGELRRRVPDALERARRGLEDEIAYHDFCQFLFFRQWGAAREAAHRRGIAVMGDVPIYVAHDSADVWAHQHLFLLDGAGIPEEVAGVPPDYFSATGQRWGNPIYRWDVMAAEGFRWWVERIRANLRVADLVRIDHFRGLVAYWSIPSAETTAVRGRWVPGPGRSLFDAIRSSIGSLPIVAEDLGVITDDVRALRDELGLPGMRVLQFAFYDGDSEHLPAHHPASTVVFTGTHDNDTARGWFEGLEPEVRARVEIALGRREASIEWDLIRAAYDSPARTVVVPMQDVLGLGSEARMNIPSVPEGNWEWRLAPEPLRPDLAERLRRLAESTGRIPAPVS